MSKNDQPNDPNALLKMWLDYQTGLMKAQQSAYPGVENFATPEMKQAMDSARESWSAWETQAADWLKVANNWLPDDMQGDGNSGNAFIAESLKRLLDPKHFSSAALDDASGSVRRMADGPGFADFGSFEKQLLQSSAEWLAMREADAHYRQITGSAWARAFQTFSNEISSDWSQLANEPRKALDRWLELANDELMRTQRQDDFLRASRKLFRATIEFRIKQRELAEIWCESQSIPTRTEVDDLHRTVTELRREIRALKRERGNTAVVQDAKTVRKKIAVEASAAKAVGRKKKGTSSKKSVLKKKKQVARKTSAKKSSSNAANREKR